MGKAQWEILFPLVAKGKTQKFWLRFSKLLRRLSWSLQTNNILKVSAFDSGKIDLADNFSITALSLSLLFCNRWREYISWSIWGSTENMNVDILDIQHCLAYVRHVWLSIRRTRKPVMEISDALVGSKVHIEDRTIAACSEESFAACDKKYKVIFPHILDNNKLIANYSEKALWAFFFLVYDYPFFCGWGRGVFFSFFGWFVCFVFS